MIKALVLPATLMALALLLPSTAMAAPSSWTGSFASSRPGWASVAVNGAPNGVDFALAIRGGQGARANAAQGAASLVAGPAGSLVELAIRVAAPADPNGELADPDLWTFAMAVNDQGSEVVEPASAIEEAPGGNHPGASVLRFRLFTPVALGPGAKVRLAVAHPQGPAFSPTVVMPR